MRKLLLSLLLIAASLRAAALTRCETECPKGWLYVCVTRGDTCRCMCAKDLSAAIEDLRSLLEDQGVSAERIADALGKYRSRACSENEEFSFEFRDGPLLLIIEGGRSGKPDKGQSRP